jgi:hypothetical protein
MIEVHVFWDEHSIFGFSVLGHSDYSSRGSDIVCSAVSALSQTALLALNEVAGITPIYTKKDGLLECRVPQDIVQKTLLTCQVIFKTILLGIENIAEQYPDFVEIYNEEV